MKRAASYPLSRGIPMSSKTRSGRKAAAASTACWPSLAVRTSFPRSRSTSARLSAESPLSSATSTRHPAERGERSSAGMIGSSDFAGGHFREPDDEFAALAGAGTASLDGAAMHLHQLLHE